MDKKKLVLMVLLLLCITAFQGSLIITFIYAIKCESNIALPIIYIVLGSIISLYLFMFIRPTTHMIYTGEIRSEDPRSTVITMFIQMFSAEFIIFVIILVYKNDKSVFECRLNFTFLIISFISYCFIMLTLVISGIYHKYKSQEQLSPQTPLII